MMRLSILATALVGALTAGSAGKRLQRGDQRADRLRPRRDAMGA